MAFSPGGIAGSAVAQAIMAIISMMQQNKVQGEYEGDADQQIADALGIAGKIGPETLNTYDASAQQMLRQLQNLTGDTARNRAGFLTDFDTRGNQLQAGYQDRYNTAARDLRDYGQQGYADIDRGSAEQAAQFALNPLSRGSTIGTSVRQSLENERQQNRRRFGEDLVRMKTDILANLSGDKLASQGNINASRAAYDAALRDAVLGSSRDIANFYGTNASNRANIVNQGYGTFLDTIMGIDRVPPPQNQLPFMFGQNAVRTPSPPSTWDMLWPQLAGGAANLAGMAATGGILGSTPFHFLHSDRTQKTDFKEVDEADALRRLETLPVERWRYLAGGPEHIGPMAQDFSEVFGFGDDKMIPVVDAIGILMASVKALSAEVRELRKQKAHGA